MTLVCKTTQGSRVQLNKTPLTLHCVPIVPSKVSLCPHFPHCAHLCLPHPPLPLVIGTLLPVSMGYVYLFLDNPFTFFHPASFPLPSESCQSVVCVHASVSILFISFHCSLDSTQKWDRMAFVFLWLAKYHPYYNIPFAFKNMYFKRKWHQKTYHLSEIIALGYFLPQFVSYQCEDTETQRRLRPTKTLSVIKRMSSCVCKIKHVFGKLYN